VLVRAAASAAPVSVRFVLLIIRIQASKYGTDCSDQSNITDEVEQQAFQHEGAWSEMDFNDDFGGSEQAQKMSGFKGEEKEAAQV
jgi:hypothetical protein